MLTLRCSERARSTHRLVTLSPPTMHPPAIPPSLLGDDTVAAVDMSFIGCAWSLKSTVWHTKSLRFSCCNCWTGGGLQIQGSEKVSEDQLDSKQSVKTDTHHLLALAPMHVALGQFRLLLLFQMQIAW